MRNPKAKCHKQKRSEILDAFIDPILFSRQTA